MAGEGSIPFTNSSSMFNLRGEHSRSNCLAQAMAVPFPPLVSMKPEEEYDECFNIKTFVDTLVEHHLEIRDLKDELIKLQLENNDPQRGPAIKKKWVVKDTANDKI